MVSEPARRGWCYEVIGDLRILGGLDDAQESYEKAADCYADVENDIGWLGEPEFTIVLTGFFDLADAADHDVPRQKKSRITTESLAERIAYKREHVPDLVAAIADDVSSGI